VAGFFKKFGEWLRPIRRDDPVFGSMRFMGQKLGYWEAKAYFAPMASTVELFVEANTDDCFEAQHHFYEFLTREWSEIAANIAPKLREIWERVNQRQMGPDIWKEFTVDSISIPKSVPETANWTLSSSSKSNEGLSFWVELKGKVPESVSYDS
jgi:hypothetical protein